MLREQCGVSRGLLASGDRLTADSPTAGAGYVEIDWADIYRRSQIVVLDIGTWIDHIVRNTVAQFVVTLPFFIGIAIFPFHCSCDLNRAWSQMVKW